jgi:molybdopterin/thiamine biosynthesis adenylyltransferase/rhodanese-related sulfurtransferase
LSAAERELRFFVVRPQVPAMPTTSSPSFPALSSAELVRYSRNILLPGFGVEAQRKLQRSRVLVIGAGGLGSPAALYLAAAGVGTLGLAEFDRLEPHNLQRQILHDTASIGQAKLRSAVLRLQGLNPHIAVQPHAEGITAANALELFSRYEVVVDGTDNFPSRYLNNDAAVLTGRPLVYGSIFQFEGQVSVFAPSRGGPCYRCLFPEPPPPGSVPNCGEAGVIGALCGTIGSLQAMEAIKLLTGIGEPLIGRLLVHDALTAGFRTLNIRRDPACPVCGETPRLRGIQAENYAFSCAATPPATTALPADNLPLEIDVAEAAELHSRGATLLDVREPFEHAIGAVPGSILLPMRQVPEALSELPRNGSLLVICHHGGRSRRVAEYLRQQGFARATNVRGGIDAWSRQIDARIPRY